MDGTHKLFEGGPAAWVDPLQELQSIICPPINDMYSNTAIHVVL